MKLRVTLERYLKETGLSASTLADKAGIPKATLLGWLAGKAPRDLNQLRCVAKFIGTTIDDLVFDDGNEPAMTSQLLAGFLPDSDGWHKGVVEIKIRHIQKKSSPKF